MVETQRIYTIPEVAKILSVHKDTVQRWIEEGRLDYVKIGYRTTRILQSDIDRFIQNLHTVNNCTIQSSEPE